MNTAKAKIKTYIGFAVKSGKYVFGVDYITSSRKKIYLIIYDTALGDNSLSKLSEFARERGIAIYATDNLAELTSREGVKAVAIRDKSLADALVNTLNTEVKSE